jgi:phenylacetate-CoA ligase
MTPIALVKDFSLTLRGILHYHVVSKKICNWSEEKVKDYQFKKIKYLLIESYSGVPYYQELFKSLNFDPAKDFQKMEDLQHIPILTKQKAREVRPFLDNAKYAQNAMKLRTSGSTGEPFEVSVSDNAWVVEQSVVWRHWAWGGYNFRDKLAMVRSYVPPVGAPPYKHEKLRNFYMFSPFNLNDEKIAEYLDIMRRENIKILRGYPSSVLTLAEFVGRTGHSIPNLKLILTASESLTEKDRYIIESAFKTKVSNHYGLAEIVVMMGDCQAHEGLHNYDDYGYLELLDTDVANEKRIIGTHLHNLATPLIRYDTGDLAEVLEKPTTCGHTFQTVKNIIGRRDQQIQTPEGYKVPTVNFYTMFEAFQDVVRWQIVQRELNHIEFILQAPNLKPERIEILRTAIYTRLPASIRVDIYLDKYFIQKNEGKITPFISMIP